jgi:hypothetical protein
MTVPQPQVTFASLVNSLIHDKSVTVGSGRGFGSGSLKVDGRIFAMVSADRLVLKLPSQRVNELIATGKGELDRPGFGGEPRAWRYRVVLCTACSCLSQQ